MAEEQIHPHKGKWSGIGQVSVPIGNGILILITKVCGECGFTKIDTTNVDISSVMPKGKKKKK
jgi:hypothetical protein